MNPLLHPSISLWALTPLRSHLSEQGQKSVSLFLCMHRVVPVNEVAILGEGGADCCILAYT